jgi:hypothetical protein
MDALLVELTRFLQELNQMGIVLQVLTLASIPSAIILIFGGFYLALTRKVKAQNTQYRALHSRLEKADADLKLLTQERDKLQTQTSATFLNQHSREMRQHNDEKAMKLAEDFIERQREALTLAFKTRMKEAIGHAMEDGSLSYGNARHWAVAALALAPDDNDLRALVEGLAAAAAATASGAKVRLKDDADRQERLAMIDRLPKDLEALDHVFYAARDRGDYRLMLALAEHGLPLTRRAPYGVGSEWHLLFRLHWTDATRLCGLYREALATVETLIPDAEGVWGTEYPDTLMTRMLIGPCLLDLGRIEEVEQAVTGIAASVATKGLLPTHKLYQELNTIEAALADAKAAGAATTPPQYEL